MDLKEAFDLMRQLRHGSEGFKPYRAQDPRDGSEIIVDSEEKDDWFVWLCNNETSAKSINRKKNALADRDGGWKCHYCGADLDKVTCHVEHKTPKARGGKSKMDNLVLSCPKCNLKKHTKTEEEFIASQNH